MFLSQITLLLLWYHITFMVKLMNGSLSGYNKDLGRNKGEGKEEEEMIDFNLAEFSKKILLTAID